MSQNTFETPADIRGRLARSWPRIQKQILTGQLEFPCRYPVKHPSLSDRSFPSFRVEYRKWRDAWNDLKSPGASAITGIKNCRTYKDIRVIKSIEFQNADALAQFLGQKAVAGLNTLSDRLAALGYTGDTSNAAVYQVQTLLSEMSDESFQALVRLLEWRQENPGTKIALREVPVQGVGTKWIEQHTRVILAVFEDHDLLVSHEGSFLERTGLRDDDRRTLWMRWHSSRAIPGTDISEFAIRPSQMTRRPEGIRKVLMVENSTTFLSFFPSEDTLLVFGNGKMGISAVAELPWLSEVEFYYWGDMDSSGYLILDRIRSHCSSVQSLMMGREAMETNMSARTPDTGLELAEVPELTQDEAFARDLLLSRKLRIEQEQIVGAPEALTRHGLIEVAVEMTA